MSRAPLVLLALTVVHASAEAQVAVSANDAKVALVDGVTTIVRNPPPDTVTIIDLSTSPPRVAAEVRAPASVIGPPQSVAVAPDSSIALVTSSTKIDPADPSKTVPDDRVTVIDLKASPAAVLATLHAGSGASGVSFNRAGTLALVANRMEGTVSVFTVSGRSVAPVAKVDLGARESGPSHVVFSADGRMALVTRNNDSLISILSVNGATVEYTKRDLAAGLRPYSIDVSADGAVAVVGHVGAGPSGGADTVSVIDLASSPPRAVDHISVGPIAEGVAMSPDGRYVAVTVMDGTNQPRASPFFKESGRLAVLGVKGKTLVRVAEAPVGKWCQGAAWSPDSRKVLVQCMVEREIVIFGFDGARLTPAGSLKVNGGPAGIRTAR